MARRNHQPVRVSMDESKRDVVRTTKALIGSLTIKYSVVCQEGCYPDKKKHANQDAFCASAMHGGKDDGLRRTEVTGAANAMIGTASSSTSKA